MRRSSFEIYNMLKTTGTLFLVIVLNILQPSLAAVFTNDQVTKIDSFVAEVMKCKQVPGLTLAVAKGTETWTKGFGTADIDAGSQVTTETLFGIGSLTKAFTSTLIAIYISESNGRYTWNSKVKDILGDDFAFIDDYRTRTTTLRDLLSHRTGLDTNMLSVFGGTYTGKSLAEFAGRVKYLEAVNELRNVYEYNNLMYGLAGRIVEVLSGMSYREALKKKILQPLGMSKTDLMTDTFNFKSTGGFAKPYVLTTGPLMLEDPLLYKLYPVDSAGDLASTANDISKWLQFLLREGKTSNNVTLVNPKILKEAFRNHMNKPLNPSQTLKKPTFPVGSVDYGYGYGWNVGTYRGYAKISHTGSLYSYLSHLQFYPDKNFAVFSGVSGPGTGAGERTNKMLGYFLSDLLLGETPWLTSSTACSFPSPWINVPSSPQQGPGKPDKRVDCKKCFVGTYGHYFHGDVEVKVEESSGIVKMHTNSFTAELIASASNSTLLMYFLGPFEVLSTTNNQTDLIPLSFGKFESGHFTELNVFGTILRRGITFSNPIPPKTEKPSNSVDGLLPNVVFYYLSIMILLCALV